MQSYLKKSDIRALIDERNEKIGRKIRDAEMKKYPYMLIVGEKEAAENQVSVRKHGQVDLGTMPTDDFAAMIRKQVEEEQNKR